jgi:hypothetical protein
MMTHTDVQAVYGRPEQPDLPVNGSDGEQYIPSGTPNEYDICA